MTKTTTPVLEPRDAAAFVAESLKRLPAYVPGWRPGSTDAGGAVVQIYGRYLKTLADRVNQAPDKHKLAFLQMLGVELLPAQAARAPMVFTPLPFIGDSRVPERTRVSATVEGRSDPLIFETEEAIALAAARLSQVVTLWPGRDAYADHTASALRGEPFTLFDPLVPVRHELYLAHAPYLALVGKSTVEVQLELASPGSTALAPIWEYWDGEVWRAFKDFVSAADAGDDDSVDRTLGLTRGGIVRLVADCAETKTTTIDGIASRWIRARLESALLPASGLRLPEVERITLSVVVDRQLPSTDCASLDDAVGIVPDNAFAGSQRLDLTAAVQPLGMAPQIGSAFYVQCDEAFDRPGAEVTLCFRKQLTPEEKADQENGDFELDVAAAQKLVVSAATDNANALLDVAKIFTDTMKDTLLPVSLEDQKNALKDARDALATKGIDGISDLADAAQALIDGFADIKFAFDLLGDWGDWDFTEPDFDALDPSDIVGSFTGFKNEYEKKIDDAFSDAKAAAGEIDNALDELKQLTPYSAAMAAGAKLPTIADPSVAWEYWDGSGWRGIGATGTPKALTFRENGPVTFTVPDDMETVEHAGTTARWLRARLVSGGYGIIRVTSWKDEASGKLNFFPIIEPRPPKVDRVQLGYLYHAPRAAVEHCRTYNDFAYVDHDDDARTVSTPFEPFAMVADTIPALYVGFDAPLPADQIGLFFDIEEVIGETDGPELVWEYWNGSAWSPARVRDDTHALALPGAAAVLWPGVPVGPSATMLTAHDTYLQVEDARRAAGFVAGDRVLVGERAGAGELAMISSIAADVITLATPLSKAYGRGTIALAPLARFGTPSTWLRARLASDGEPRKSVVNGVYVNAVWASQLDTRENEVLGSSTGEPNQVFFFRNTPVLEGETIEVRELSGERARVEEPILRDELTAAGVADEDIRSVTDRRTGQISEVWVTWHAVANLAFADAGARVYAIERSRGRLLFGGDPHGLAPVVGTDNVVVRRYRSGGGTIGNVARGTISKLLAGVPAQSVANVRAAEGGADGQSIDDVLRRGQAIVRHRRQAITTEDYEALAHDASPAVAVARALPTRHSSGRFAPGYVTVLLVPRSADARPVASFELRQRVQRFLSARAPAAIAAHIAVIPATYFPVGVSASITPVDADDAGTVVETVSHALAAFLHPLTGGPDGEGWPFGRDIFLSDVASVVESTDGVDYAASLALLVNGTPAGERVQVPRDRIVAADVVRVTIYGGEG